MKLFVASTPVNGQEPSGLLSLALVDETGRAFYAERIGYLPERLCPGGQAKIDRFQFRALEETAVAHAEDRLNRLRPFYEVPNHQLGENVTAIVANNHGILKALQFWLEPYAGQELTLHGIAPDVQFSRLNLATSGLFGQIGRGKVSKDLDTLLAKYEMSGANIIQTAYGHVPPAPAGTTLEMVYAVKHMLESLLQSELENPDNQTEPEGETPVESIAGKLSVRPQDK